jgi:flotillin
VGQTHLPKRLGAQTVGTRIVGRVHGATSGMHKITGDITEMAAQIPALFETLSGMPFGEMFAKVRLIADKTPKPDDKTKGAGGAQ